MTSASEYKDCKLKRYKMGRLDFFYKKTLERMMRGANRTANFAVEMNMTFEAYKYGHSSSKRDFQLCWVQGKSMRIFVMKASVKFLRV